MKKIIIVYLILLFICNPAFSQWEKVNYPFKDADSFVSFITTDSIVYASSTYEMQEKGSGVLCSKDNGTTWKSINYGLSDFHVTLGICKNILLAATPKGVFTLNIGDTIWSPSQNASPYLISFASNDSLIFGGTVYGGVYVSKDSGKSWIKKNSGLPYGTTVRSIAINGSIVYLGTDEGVFLSTDFGEKWNYKSDGIPEYRSVRSLMIKDNLIYAGTNLEGIFVSDNNGESWQAKNNGLSDFCNVFSIAHADSIVFIATLHKGVFYSTNNGESWKEFNDRLLPNYINTIAFGNNYLFAGSKGQGIWRYNLSALTNLDTKQIANLSVYFNYYDNQLIIENHDLASFNIQLYNSNGQIMYQARNANNLSKINLNKFSGGMYVVKVTSGKKAITKKIIIN